MPLAPPESWLETLPCLTTLGPAVINEYYVRHPEQILGTLTLTSDRFHKEASEPTVEGVLTPEVIDRALATVPTSLYVAGDRPPTILETAQEYDLTHLKEGGYDEQGGQLIRRVRGQAEPLTVSGLVAQRIRGMLGIRDAVRQVISTQLRQATSFEVTAARVRLNRLYDSFVSTYGPLSSRANVKALAGDPDQALLLALEKFDPDTNRATKAAMFERPTIESAPRVAYVETAEEALSVSLNDYARIHWPRLEELTGRSRGELIDELGALVYRNPAGGEYETADLYLSGNVRRKLEEAQAAAALDPSYQRNVDALFSVQPTDLKAAEIEGSLGSPWIPKTDIQQFLEQLLGSVPDSITIVHIEALAVWNVEADYQAKNLVSNIQTYGTHRFTAVDLVEKALNGRVPVAYDEDPQTRRKYRNNKDTFEAQERQQQLSDRFRHWLWSDEVRAERLAKLYNQRYNNLRLRTFDGSYLTFPGMVRSELRAGDLDPHQKNAVARILQTGVALLAHCVGAGKTWTIVAAVMEMKRLGLCKKPMIVVPNHLVSQWASAFLALYPQANLFIAGEDTFSKANRPLAMSRMATGVYDAMIMSHKSFEFLPVSDDLFADFIQEQIDLLEGLGEQAKGTEEERIVTKEVLRAVKGLKERLQKRGIPVRGGTEEEESVKGKEQRKAQLKTKLQNRRHQWSKDQTLSFEELGVDALFVDEFHAYKNLFRISKMRVSGLPNQDSFRAFDMFLKTRYVLQRNRGRNLVTATATPIANSVAEMYTMTRYHINTLLEERGIDHFDAWVANFARTATCLEVAPDGSGFRMATRMALFVNLPELMQLYWTFADVQTAETLQLPRPALMGGKPCVIAAPSSPALKTYIEILIHRAEACRNRLVKPEEDNMLKITSDGRKAALDMRIVDPAHPRDPRGKLAKAAEQIYRIWEETKSIRATQMVFCDLSTPDRHAFNAYDDLRCQLLEKGVPSEEIAFIHHVSKAGKQRLFDAVNAGRVRILFGSTEKMGAGTNAQRRLLALHNLDCPWRPCDLEQRAGRMLRQGNMHKEVWLFHYVTEGSFDAYLYQAVERKTMFISQVMSGEVTVRQMEDLESPAFTVAEIKAIASGNPAIIEKCKLDLEVNRLEKLRIMHDDSLFHARWGWQKNQETLMKNRERVEQIRADRDRRDAHAEDKFSMQIGERLFTGKESREAAARLLVQVVLSWKNDPAREQRGSYRGFTIWSEGKQQKLTLEGIKDVPPALYLHGALAHECTLNAENPLGTLSSFSQVLAYLDHHLAVAEQEVQDTERRMADYARELDKPFEQEEQLQQARQRLRELVAELDLDKNDAQAAASTEAPADDSEGTSLSAEPTESDCHDENRGDSDREESFNSETESLPRT